MMPLEGVALGIGVSEHAKADTALPNDFLVLDTYVREPLARERIGLDPGGRVASRVTLNAGRIAGWNAGALWVIDDADPRRIAWRSQWIIEGIRRDHLALNLEGLDGALAKRPPDLHPVNGAIELLVCHVRPDDLPPGSSMEHELSVGSPAPDFAAYYSLFDHPAETPVPKYYAADDVSETPAEASTDGISEGEASATTESTLISPVCIHAVAHPAPPPATVVRPRPR
jgi:hypothetical protein